MRKFILTLLCAALFVSAPRPARAYQLYFGDLHSHTSFSDGAGLPDEAYDFARFKAGIDYLAVSDHVERFGYRADLPPGAPKQKTWDATVDAARVKNADGEFIAIAAFEWAMDFTQGHINVINCADYPNFGNGSPLKQFYRWLQKRPGAMFGYNHPNEESERKFVFNHFAFVPEVASQAIYVATNIPLDFPFYYMALDNGWRVAPSAQQDNHGKDWGLDPSSNLTAVYADALTMDGLMEAFRSRRFYATNDRALQLWVAGNGEPMGSVIRGGAAKLEIKVDYKGGKSIESVKLVTNGGKIEKQWSPGKSVFEQKVEVKNLSGKREWRVVLVEAAGGRFAVSAPIILEQP